MGEGGAVEEPHRHFDVRAVRVQRQADDPFQAVAPLISPTQIVLLPSALVCVATSTGMKLVARW